MRPDSLDEGAVGAIGAAEDIELHSSNAVVGPVVGFQPCVKLEGCLGAIEDGLIRGADMAEKLDGGRETRVRVGSLGVDRQEREVWALRVALAYEGEV